jgi:hypothetical protein
MEIKRVGSQPSAKGPSEWFTGTVRIDPLLQAPDAALVQGASVTFEPADRGDPARATWSGSQRLRVRQEVKLFSKADRRVWRRARSFAPTVGIGGAHGRA